MKLSGKITWVGIYAIAMAFLETAVVVYLRRIYGITDLMLSVPPFDPQIAAVELGRELATLVMLLAIGWVAGERIQSKLSFALIAFGIWDIFYYIWLALVISWPRSIFDTDLLFLIPLPWWGPVIAPVLISLLMIIGGILIVRREDQGIIVRLRISDGIFLGLGILIMLYVFMQDAISILPATSEELSSLKPSSFNWFVFMIGYVLSAVTVWRIVKKKPSHLKKNI